MNKFVRLQDFSNDYSVKENKYCNDKKKTNQVFLIHYLFDKIWLILIENKLHSSLIRNFLIVYNQLSLNNMLYSIRSFWLPIIHTSLHINEDY